MPERSHTPMGHAHCTSGAPTCSEIPHSLAWSRKAHSIHDVPRGGTVRVLTNRDVKPSGRVLRLCPAFCLREARWWLQLEVRKTSNLHYTTALHTISPVFSNHTTISPVFSHHTTLHNSKHTKHTHATRVHDATLYSDDSAPSKQHRSKGFQTNGSPARTITVALDMSKAFDTINIHTLIRKLLQTKIPGTIIKLIANYIKGRKAYTT